MLLIRNRRAANCLAIAVAFVMMMCAFVTAGTTKAYAATSYNLWVGGTRVTSDNANSNSAWSYNASTRTLTLKSYTYSGKGHTGKIYSSEDEDYVYFNAPIFWSDTQPLTINVTGTNKVTAAYITDDEYVPVGIFARGNVTFSGSGTLTATGGAKTEYESIGVYTLDGDVTVNSGTLNAVGGTDCDSYGIYAAKRVFVNGGTLTATGGTLYSPEAESLSTGIYSEYLVIKGGTVNATGGSAGIATSAGFCSSLRMNGGTLNAKGGSAGIVSSGAYQEGPDSQIIVGGTATFTGGTCSKGSYGLYNLLDGDDPSSHTVHYTANVTAKGNTAASNQIFDYDYDDEMILDYLDEDEGGFISDDEDGDDSEEETIERVGSYYIFSKRYAPIVKAGTSVDGTGTTRYVAPSPALDIYTNRKYVNITPAKLPTSIQLSEHNYHQTSTGDTMQPTVTYTPSDADIKAVNWSSSNESIATVNSNGLITVVATETGYTDIYARIGNCSDGCRVTYAKPSEVTPTITITYDGSEPVIRTKEGTLQLNASVTPASYASELVWDSSIDNEIATFDKNTGIVTGHSNGTVRISARLSGHPAVTVAIDITVSIPAGPGCEHLSVTSFTSPATFESDGYIRRTCSDCQETLSEEVIPRVSTKELAQTEFEYDGQAKEPEVVVKDRLGKVLRRYYEYNVYYYDNVSPGTGYARIELDSNYGYYGTYDLYFTITCPHKYRQIIISPANGNIDGRYVEKCDRCSTVVIDKVIPCVENRSLSQRTFEYTGEPIEPEVIFSDREGYTLVEGTDYDVTYENNVEIGRATARVQFKGNYDMGYLMYFDIVPVEFDDSLLRLNKKSISYSKDPVLPEVVFDGDYDIDDFTVEYVNPGNKNVGIHSVIVTSTKYGVNKKLTYVIKPAGTKLRTPVAGRKAITVKWNRQAARMAKYRITGYQIQYSLNKNFKNAKKISVKGYKATSKKISKLKPGKKYYVRVRTYRTVNGRNYFSAWTAKKAVTTKK